MQIIWESFSGELPQPRPSFQPSEPDGCSSSLVGFQVNTAVGGLFITPQPKATRLNG